MDLVTVTRQSGLAFTIALGDHRLTTDMSVAEGGTGTGLSPVEMLSAAVGGCLAIMTQRYCDARGYTDGDVGVSLTAELVDGPKRVSSFVIDLELPADVPEAEREKLRGVALRFPVPATLRDAPGFELDFA